MLPAILRVILSVKDGDLASEAASSVLYRKDNRRHYVLIPLFSLGFSFLLWTDDAASGVLITKKIPFKLN